MYDPGSEQGRRNLSVGVTALVSAALFYSGFFTFLFAVPVQVAFSRHGRHRGLSAAGTTAVMVLVVHSFQAARMTAVTPGLVLSDALLPMGMLGGLALFNVARQYPWWLRLLLAGGVALLAAVPSLRIIAAIGDGNGETAHQFRAMLTMMGIEHGHDVWADLVRRVVFSSIGLAMTAGVAANWWLGTGIVRRGDGGVVSLRTARVPERLIWIVIAGLAVVLLSWVGGTERIAPIGWNLLLVSAFLFAIQGVGLIQHMLVRRGVGRIGERWVLTFVLVGLFIPGVNIMVAGGLPLLGMSELWIDYKRGERYNESNT